MATGESDSPGKFSDTDVCNCSICLEQFKTPKSLPCLHTFCEACLNTYIISSSKSGKTPPKHFNCPVCRAEVKPPDPSVSVEKWASLMPTNQRINSLMETSEKLEKPTECDSCKFTGKIVSGEFWCFECQEFLCNRCKMEHTRNKFLRNHKLIPASDVSKQDTVIHVVTAEVEEPCTEHKGEILKVYCVDHQKMCCVLCLSINHRKCEHIKTFDEMAENMKKKGQVEQFFDKMKDMNSRVERISTGKRENITNIQKQQTAILDKADNLIQEAKAKIDKCHQEFKDKVSYLLKEQTTKLIETADRVDNFQNSLTNCQQVWSAVIESGSPKQIFTTFEKIRDCIETERKELEAYLKEDQIISLDIKMNNLVTDVTTLTSVAEVQVKVSPSGESLSMDMAGVPYAGHATASVNMESPCIHDIEPVKIWDVNDSGWFTGGTFLRDGRLLLLNHRSKTLNLYNDDGQISYGVSYKPWDAVQHTDDNIYVTSKSDNNIRVYTLSSNTSTFKEVKIIKTDTLSCGLNAINITTDNQILVEYGRCIYIMTMDGKTKRTVETSKGHSFIATSTSDTWSVFYYCDDTEVVCQSVSGNELMRYQIPGIKGTRGIALDKWGNIYVCGSESNNASVVSKDGKSSRVLLSKIEDVSPPYKVGFDGNGSKFFVTGFDNGKAVVFKFNVKKIRNGNAEV